MKIVHTSIYIQRKQYENSMSLVGHGGIRPCFLIPHPLQLYQLGVTFPWEKIFAIFSMKQITACCFQVHDVYFNGCTDTNQMLHQHDNSRTTRHRVYRVYHNARNEVTILLLAVCFGSTNFNSSVPSVLC